MALYVILEPVEWQPLEAAIAEHFKDNFFKVAPLQFIISTSNSTSEVNEILGLKEGKIGGRAMIVRVENYAGWHSKDLWEWMAAKVKETPVGTAPQNG